MDKQYLVEIVEKATHKVVKEMGAASYADAIRIAAGASINMSDQFTTRITEKTK